MFEKAEPKTRRWVTRPGGLGPSPRGCLEQPASGGEHEDSQENAQNTAFPALEESSSPNQTTTAQRKGGQTCSSTVRADALAHLCPCTPHECLWICDRTGGRRYPTNPSPFSPGTPSLFCGRKAGRVHGVPKHQIWRQRGPERALWAAVPTHTKGDQSCFLAILHKYLQCFLT